MYLVFWRRRYGRRADNRVETVNLCSLLPATWWGNEEGVPGWVSDIWIIHLCVLLHTYPFLRVHHCSLMKEGVKKINESWVKAKRIQIFSTSVWVFVRCLTLFHLLCGSDAVLYVLCCYVVFVIDSIMSWLSFFFPALWWFNMLQQTWQLLV